MSDTQAYWFFGGGVVVPMTNEVDCLVSLHAKSNAVIEVCA